MSESTGRLTVGQITPTPSPDEVAAIVAAIEMSWPQPSAVAEAPDTSTAWRFSGRWWLEGRLPQGWR